MKKWAYLSVAAALAAIIGCGGGGGHHSNNTNGSTNGDGITTQARVNVGASNSQGIAYGRAEFDFLTGQGIGSRDPGDLTAVIRRVTLEDQFGVVSTTSPVEQSFPLRTFTSQIVGLDVPFTGQNSRLFESFELSFIRFEVETDNGGSSNLTAPQPATFPARIRVFPGRNTNIPILINDAMYFSNGSSVDFDRNEFELRNLRDGYIHSFLSDYVMFDVSNMPAADRPQLSTGEVADRIYMSGDDIAISAGGQSGTIEVLTTDPSQPIIGSYGPQNVLTGLPGTYNLTQIDPTDLEGRARITSLHGIWRNLDTVITGVGNFEMIAFPSANDNSTQDVMVVSKTNGVITGMYFGQINYDLGQFHIFPVANLVNADVSGELTGTIDHYMRADGAVTTSPDNTRFGHFTFDSGQTLPTGFQNTGTFIVFRR